MWTPADRALVGDFGSGQALTDDQFRLLERLIPPAKPGGRPRTTDMRRLLDGLFYLVRTGCQWRHLPPPPAFPPWRTIGARETPRPAAKRSARPIGSVRRYRATLGTNMTSHSRAQFPTPRARAASSTVAASLSTQIRRS